MRLVAKISLALALTLALTLSLATGYAVECGADQIDKVLARVGSRRVALIINHTSVVGPDRVCLLDTLLARGVDVRCIFAPEHGFRGDADAGATVADGRDVKSGLPIVSLYGKNKRPTREQLAQIDVVIFDIQDVGARFYTYISTLYYAMQACGENGVDVVVLDRPNPNDFVDGPMMQESLKSFVGALSLPLLHGVTVGELAQMICGEGWCEKSPKLDVVPIVGWRHGDKYSLPIKPSPNLPTDNSVALYPSLCLFEATQMSVGRGTYFPFEVVGYPDSKYGDFTFTPAPLKGSDMNPLQSGKLCYGLDLRGAKTDGGLSLSYFIEMMRISEQGAKFISRPQFFDMLAGDSTLRQMLGRGCSEAEIRATWQPALTKYRAMRRRYLLYPDYK